MCFPDESDVGLSQELHQTPPEAPDRANERRSAPVIHCGQQCELDRLGRLPLSAQAYCYCIPTRSYNDPEEM